MQAIAIDRKDIWRRRIDHALGPEALQQIARHAERAAVCRSVAIDDFQQRYFGWSDWSIACSRVNAMRASAKRALAFRLAGS